MTKGLGIKNANVFLERFSSSLNDKVSSLLGNPVIIISVYFLLKSSPLKDTYFLPFEVQFLLLFGSSKFVKKEGGILHIII